MEPASHLQLANLAIHAAPDVHEARASAEQILFSQSKEKAETFYSEIIERYQKCQHSFLVNEATRKNLDNIKGWAWGHISTVRKAKNEPELKQALESLDMHDAEIKEIENVLIEAANSKALPVEVITAQATVLEAAQKYHQNWSIATIVLVGIVITVICSITYLKFADPPKTSDTGLVFLGLTRLSILLFSAWAVRTLIVLHKAHAEQAIIYRDRHHSFKISAALLRLSNSNEEKRRLLANLIKSSFDLTKNSFHAVKDRGIFPSKKQIKEFNEAIIPFLDMDKSIAKDEKREKSTTH